MVLLSRQVAAPVCSDPWLLTSPTSTHFILPGRSGLIPLQPRVATFRTLPAPRPSLKRRRAPRVGWTISKRLSPSTVSKSSGGESFCVRHHCHRFCPGRVLGVLTLPHLRLYNNIVPPSQLPQKANYYLFKVRGVPDSPSSGD